MSDTTNLPVTAPSLTLSLDEALTLARALGAAQGALGVVAVLGGPIIRSDGAREVQDQCAEAVAMLNDALNRATEDHP